MPNLPIAGLLCLSVVWLCSTDKKKSSSVKSQRGYDLVNKARKFLEQYLGGHRWTPKSLFGLMFSVEKVMMPLFLGLMLQDHRGFLRPWY